LLWLAVALTVVIALAKTGPRPPSCSWQSALVVFARRQSAPRREWILIGLAAVFFLLGGIRSRPERSRSDPLHRRGLA